MKKVAILFTAILFGGYGCTYVSQFSQPSGGSGESKEQSQAVVSEIEEVPPVVVTPRAEPPRPIEYESLADHYIPPDRTPDGAVVQGYRIQLITMTTSTAADSFAEVAKSNLEFPIYTIYDPPNYKVRAGDFADRFEADQAAEIIKRKGYETFIVRDIISTGGDN